MTYLYGSFSGSLPNKDQENEIIQLIVNYFQYGISKAGVELTLVNSSEQEIFNDDYLDAYENNIHISIEKNGDEYTVHYKLGDKSEKSINMSADYMHPIIKQDLDVMYKNSLPVYSKNTMNRVANYNFTNFILAVKSTLGTLKHNKINHSSLKEINKVITKFDKKEIDELDCIIKIQELAEKHINPVMFKPSLQIKKFLMAIIDQDEMQLDTLAAKLCCSDDDENEIFYKDTIHKL